MARRFNTMLLPRAIPEGSAYVSEDEADENEPPPPSQEEIRAADAALRRMEAALQVSQAVQKPRTTTSEGATREGARAVPERTADVRRSSDGSDDGSAALRWSDDDPAGRALNDIDDNWRDDPVLLEPARARRRTLGGRKARAPKRRSTELVPPVAIFSHEPHAPSQAEIRPPVAIVSPPPSTARLLRAREKMVAARERLDRASRRRGLCEDVGGCGCGSHDDISPMIGLCAADASSCNIM